MWATPARYTDALSGPHKVATAVTVTVPGGSAVALEIKSGTVSVDGSAKIRRKAELDLVGTKTDYDLLSTDGAIIRITHGIDFGGSDQIMLPVFAGELVEGSQQLGDGSVSASFGDSWGWVNRARYTTPFSPSPLLTRRAAMAATLIDGRPQTVVNTTASDTGLVGTAVWAESRSDCISDLAQAGVMDAFFLPDDTFLIRDQQSITSQPVWSIDAGMGGTLKTADRKRPKDKLYNTVIVRPSAADGSQSWAQQVAQVTDITHPRHPSKIGVVPLFWSSPSILDAATAMSVALRRLDRVLGTTETLSLGAISHAGLEAGDVIRVTTPTVNEQPAQTFQHFIDGYRLNLVEGDMTLSTRSQLVTDDQ